MVLMASALAVLVPGFYLIKNGAEKPTFHPEKKCIRGTVERHHAETPAWWYAFRRWVGISRRVPWAVIRQLRRELLRKHAWRKRLLGYDVRFFRRTKLRARN